LAANSYPILIIDALIQDEIWQEYNTVSMISNSLHEALVAGPVGHRQVFVFKKTADAPGDNLTAVMMPA